ncbi:hydrolase [Streptacidiphilus pinicola]|uniref:Hydrolase n=1 Tax=Streptacidiphilus pinicola TaxID=2219663 RepID=A0A2X0J537_9ACTN|nr:HAD-IA family hydrolase [Streptacidiphilus pinicola]RAG82488.1 hydrolase [Streptacidiphilus pinicola]
MTKGILFDFSGTLFRITDTRPWLDGALASLGLELPEAEAAALAGRLADAGALPGGPNPRELPEALRRLWAERDLDAVRHRAAYTGLAALADLPDPRLADVLYDRHRLPESWRPYPDTEAVLTQLRRRGVPVAVVSNIGWDLRPVFDHHGVGQLVDAYVLSFEHGVQKPDPRLFRAACDALGLDPADVLMVGDDADADGGATALGCAFLHVAHRPVEERPDSLTKVLDRIPD